MATDREELMALRRLAELEARAAGGTLGASGQPLVSITGRRITPQDYQRALEAANPSDPTGSTGENLAAGFAMPFVGAVRGLKQLGTEAGLGMANMEARALGSLGLDRLRDTLQRNTIQPLQRSLQGQQAVIDEAARLDAPLRGTGGGVTGNVLGTVAQLYGPGVLLRGTPAAGALLPTTVRGNIVQGAALGASQPVETGRSRLQATGMGGLLGGGGALIPKVVGATGRTTIGLLEPVVSKKGQERVVARALVKQATNPSNLRAVAPSTTQGVTRNLAEESLDPGISQLTRQFPEQLAEQARLNNAARAQAIRDTFEGADDASIRAIEDARDLQARTTLAGLGNIRTTPVDPLRSALGLRTTVDEAVPLSPVRDMLGRMVAANERRPAVASALEYVRNVAAKPVRNADEAYDIRKTIDDLMEGRIGGDQAASRAARSELMEVKKALDEQMSQVFPEWRQYLPNYIAQSRRADQARVGQELLTRGRQAVDPRTGERIMTPAGITGAATDVPALVRQATGFPRATADMLTPQQQGLLGSLLDDASRMDSAATLGRGLGSPTAQNLATQNVLGQMGGPLGGLLQGSQLGRSLLTPIEKSYGLLGVPERLQAVLVEALANPEYARTIIARLPPDDRGAVMEFLARLPARTGGVLGPTLGGPALGEQ